LLQENPLFDTHQLRYHCGKVDQKSGAGTDDPVMMLAIEKLFP
jgi:hypothetical protein